MKISKKGFFDFFTIFVVCLAFFKPGSYIIGTGLNILWQRASLSISILIFVYYLLMVATKRFTISKWMIVFHIFNVYIWLITSLLNKETVSIPTAILYFFQGAALVSFFDYNYQLSGKKFLRKFVYCLIFLNLLQVITMFLFFNSNGMAHDIVLSTGRKINGSYYFYTHDNGSFFMIFPAMILSWLTVLLYDEKTDRKIAILFMILTIGAFIYTWSATAMIIFILFAFSLYYFTRIPKKVFVIGKKRVGFKSIFNKSNLTIGVVLISFLLTYFQISVVFKDFLHEYLHKSADLTGRIPIWNLTIEYIKKSFIYGYGCEYDAITNIKIMMNHTHNFILQLLYTGGIIGLALFCILIFTTFKKVDINHFTNFKIDKVFIIAVIGVFLYYFASIFDFYLFQFWIYVVLDFIYILSVKKKEGDINE